MDNLLSVHSFKHGAAVFGIAAVVGLIAALVWVFVGSYAATAGTKVAAKV